MNTLKSDMAILGTRENKMAEGYYRKEKIVFEDAYKKELHQQTAMMVVKKLCRHFKVNHLQVRWTSGRNRPKGSRYYIILNVDWNNFGVLCHEIAHTIQIRKYDAAGHNKKHWRIFKRLIRYCRKKNWFEKEFERRTTPKEPKPEPTKEELRQRKIERLEQGIKRHQTKIKRCQTLIKKNNRKIVHLRRFI